MTNTRLAVRGFQTFFISVAKATAFTFTFNGLSTFLSSAVLIEAMRNVDVYTLCTTWMILLWIQECLFKLSLSVANILRFGRCLIYLASFIHHIVVGVQKLLRWDLVTVGTDKIRKVLIGGLVVSRKVVGDYLGSTCCCVVDCAWNSEHLRFAFEWGPYWRKRDRLLLRLWGVWLSQSLVQLRQKYLVSLSVMLHFDLELHKFLVYFLRL